MSTTTDERLTRLHGARNRAVAERSRITSTVQTENRTTLTADESKRFRALVAQIQTLDAEIADREDDLARAGHGNADVAHVARASMRAGNGDNGWAARAAKAVHKMGGESRAVVSGSVEIPTLVGPGVTPNTRPSRLIDLLVNRESVSANGFEYLRQTTRTNNAAPVADLAEKPESVYTVAAVTDRCRVIAHLSEEFPIRYFQDLPTVTNFLESEMREGVLDALESQIIAGSGSGENMTGLLTVSGTTAVAYNTSVPVTLRKAVTALQTIGVVPNAWVLNPADVEAVDLLRYSIAFDPEAATDSPQKYLLDGYTNGVANSANIFGDPSIQRVVSNSVPAGTAILGDWNQLKLYIREQMRLDIDAGGELFKTNAAILRAELRAGLGHLRPASFAKVDLTA